METKWKRGLFLRLGLSSAQKAGDIYFQILLLFNDMACISESVIREIGLQTYQQKSESNAETVLILLPSMSFFKKFSKLRFFVVIADKFNPRIYITVFIFS